MLCYFVTHSVPTTGLEPAHLTAPPPQDGVSTNFTTWALILANIRVNFILHLSDLISLIVKNLIYFCCNQS